VFTANSANLDDLSKPADHLRTAFAVIHADASKSDFRAAVAAHAKKFPGFVFAFIDFGESCLLSQDCCIA
jgi:hypothetical protein